MVLENKKNRLSAASGRLIPYVVYPVFALSAGVLDCQGQHIAAGFLLLLAAAVLALYFYARERVLVSCPLLLSLAWIGAEGLAVMQLSHLQSDWTWQSWMAFGSFYLFFLAGYDIWPFIRVRLTGLKAPAEKEQSEYFQERLFHCIIGVAAISFGVFLTEVCILGYIPLFSKETHAYDHFHVTGLHYFTVSCMFTHSLTAIYLLRGRMSRQEMSGKLTAKKKLILVICNLLSLSIPVLCVSKFQFVLTLALPIVIFLLMRPQADKRKLFAVLILAAAAVVAAAVFMTVRRNYKPGYLDSIFQMKNPGMPMFLQYVYMYIANNYANFNCLTEALAQHSISYTFGLRQLYPVFALSGVKFLIPQLVSFPVPVTITEMNTLTLIYDAYYDFGFLGVAGFGLVLGLVCRIVTGQAEKRDANPLICLLYAQLAVYLLLSFFSTWFSVPTTWFWLAITFVMYLYTGGFSLKRFWGRQRR